MKKKFLVAGILATAISATALCGCSLFSKGITSIEKTSSEGLVDYYTITYSDGSTYTFTVTNGKDGAAGKDGQDGQNATEITVNDVFEFYKQNGHADATVDEFLEAYLTVDYKQPTQGDLTALSSLFRSGMKMYSVYEKKNKIGITEQVASAGSAVLYKVDENYAYILTNYHMIYDENALSADKTPIKIFAYMYGSDYSPVKTSTGNIIVQDDFALTCEYVGGSADCDVAVIKTPISDLEDKYPYAQTVTINQEYEVGQTVYALGNPGGMGVSLTKGIVSVDLEVVTLDVAGVRNYYLLRTDADLDHGSSGGGLFNEDGEFVALCNSGDDDITSMNYAIPASTAVPCAEGILYYNGLSATDHSTYRLHLGITVQENNCRYVYDEDSKKGKIVADVTLNEAPESGSVAKTLGIEEGDIIRAIIVNDKRTEITRKVNMDNVLMQIRAGNRVKIAYERGGAETVSDEFVVQTDLLVKA